MSFISLQSHFLRNESYHCICPKERKYCSFAQRQYRSQWISYQTRLLLVENIFNHQTRRCFERKLEFWIHRFSFHLHKGRPRSYSVCSQKMNTFDSQKNHETTVFSRTNGYLYLTYKFNASFKNYILFFPEPADRWDNMKEKLIWTGWIL